MIRVITIRLVLPIIILIVASLNAFCESKIMNVQMVVNSTDHNIHKLIMKEYASTDFVVKDCTESVVKLSAKSDVKETFRIYRMYKNKKRSLLCSSTIHVGETFAVFHGSGGIVNMEDLITMYRSKDMNNFNFAISLICYKKKE